MAFVVVVGNLLNSIYGKSKKDMIMSMICIPNNLFKVIIGYHLLLTSARLASTHFIILGRII